MAKKAKGEVQTRKRANGEGLIRKRGGNSWEGQYSTWDENGKRHRHSVYGKSNAEVVKKLNAVLNEINTGVYIAPDMMTVGEWCDIWTKDYLGDVKESTVNQYSYQIRVHIKPALGSLKLQKITAPMIQRFYNESMKEHKDSHGKKVKGLSAKSVKNLHGVLHKVFQQAVACSFIKVNPCDACKLPKVQKHEMNTIQGQSVVDFLKAISSDEYCNLYYVDMFTGLRQGEIIGLTWDCIDFDKGIIRVYRQLRRDHSGKGEEYKFTSLKNGKERTITPASSVFDALKKERSKQAENRLKHGADFSNEYDLVFTNEIGGHLTGVTVYNHLKSILASIGLANVRFHDLRHTYATLSIQNGDDIKTVSENLGHATVAFTLDVYGHVTDEMKKKSADKMQAFIESLGG